MTEVYLVRHAIAEERDASRWPDDSRRPLTADGVERFRRAAEGLQRLVPTVDRLLSSPYDRSWQTAELLRDVAGWPVPEGAEELAADRPPADALALLRAGVRLALVGHEPGLSSLASLLLAGQEDAVELQLKKGGTIALAFDGGPALGTARLLWLAPPRVLRYAASSSV